MTQTQEPIGSAVELPGLQVVVMGVSGSGKTTVGRLLAERLDVDYADADDFHSESNKAKLHAGIALTDEDREPWLRAIGSWLADRQHTGGVASCSALRRRYRDLLRSLAPDLVLLFCDGNRDLIASRLTSRQHHFMSPELLDSQLASLERPEPDERCITADISQPPDVVVQRFAADVVRLLAAES
jgi:gluconokinase